MSTKREIQKAKAEKNKSKPGWSRAALLKALKEFGALPDFSGSGVDTVDDKVTPEWLEKAKARGHMRYREPTLSDDDEKGKVHGAKNQAEHLAGMFDVLKKPSEVLGRANPLNYMFAAAGSPHMIPINKKGPDATWREFIHGGTKKDNDTIAKVVDELKNDPDMAGTSVHMGERPFTDLYKSFTNPKTSLMAKLLYGSTLAIPHTLLSLLSTHRSNHYNPFSDSVTVTSPDPGVLRHELGHAQDFNRSENPSARAILPTLEQMLAKASQGTIPNLPVPGSTMYLEYRANRNAINKLLREKVKQKKLNQKDIDEVTYANQMLGGSYGSYSGAASGVPLGGLLGIPLGAATANATNAWSNTDDHTAAYKKRVNDFEKQLDKKKLERAKRK